MFACQIATNLLGPYALCTHPAVAAAADRGARTASVHKLDARAEGYAGVGQFATTQHAMKAVADSLRDEVNTSGVRVMSIFLGRTATERQRAIFAAERDVPTRRNH